MYIVLIKRDTVRQNIPHTSAKRRRTNGAIKRMSTKRGDAMMGDNKPINQTPCNKMSAAYFSGFAGIMASVIWKV